MRKLIIALIVLTAGFFLVQMLFAPLESHAINGGDKAPSFDPPTKAKVNPDTSRTGVSPVQSVVPDAAQKVKVNNALGKLSLPFIANEGQTDEQVAFYAPTFAGTVFVTKEGELVYALQGRQVEAEAKDKEKKVAKGKPYIHDNYNIQG